MISETLYSSRTEEWETPQDFFDRLKTEFNFTLDACATAGNTKCSNFITREQNAFKQDWNKLAGGGDIWMNPPYGKEISHWMQKAFETSLYGSTVVCLVHARTDTRWFHNWVYHKAEIRFVKGRLKFGGSKNSAPFPSMIVIYRKPNN